LHTFSVATHQKNFSQSENVSMLVSLANQSAINLLSDSNVIFFSNQRGNSKEQLLNMQRALNMQWFYQTFSYF